MVWLLRGVLDLFVAQPYLMPVPLALGWALIRYNGRVRRRLKALGWSRQPRRLLAGTMSAIGAALIMLTVGFLLPVLILLVTGS